MTADPKRDKPSGKMAYIKPKLRTIELVAEEVLGTGCKNSSTPGMGLGPCTATGCSGNGS